MRALPVAGFALALAACNSGFEPQYLVQDLRVLAIDAEVVGTTAADAIPGDTLGLTALVANPLGRAGLTVTWYGCLPTADESLPPCADPAYLADSSRLATAAAVSGSGVLALGSCTPSADDGVCSVTVAIPAIQDVTNALAFIVNYAEQDPAYKCRLYAEMPVVAVAEAVGGHDVALKRARVTPDPATLPTDLAGVYVRNLNPGVLEVYRAPTDPSGGCVGGTPITPEPFPTGQTVLCADAWPSSDQSYNQCSPTGDLIPTYEDLSWQWFTTGGEFPDFGEGIGNATGRSVDFIRPPGPFTLWAILRDGRGGEVWLRRHVCPPDATNCVSAPP